LGSLRAPRRLRPRLRQGVLKLARELPMQRVQEVRMQSASSRSWFDVRVPATYRMPGCRGLGTASQLSPQGAVIERATQPAPLWARLTVELALPDAELALTAEVVRRTADGFAVRFAPLPPRSARRLADLLAKAESNT
jgi:hypothetical protein